jgi:hypothetical protein
MDAACRTADYQIKRRIREIINVAALRVLLLAASCLTGFLAIFPWPIEPRRRSVADAVGSMSIANKKYERIDAVSVLRSARLHGKRGGSSGLFFRLLAGMMGVGVLAAPQQSLAQACSNPQSLSGSVTLAAGTSADTNSMCWEGTNGLQGPCNVTVTGTFDHSASWPAGLTGTISPNPTQTYSPWVVHVTADSSVPAGTYLAVANGTAPVSGNLSLPAKFGYQAVA